ncbi:tyrosine-type recombinase/integrase [Mycobacteroides abscessus]|uniref:tyrosine-type recombinase/integrase n=1 Tax=Mycobacteroides abscessus TaxID=36809 RepID=UPI0021030DF9|nr:site-specific integrase [Mycobacteroides abscessus]
MNKRSMRAGVEDRWHRPAKRDEAVPFPADQPGAGSWCLDPKHGQVGTLVTTTRHGSGKRWQARWVDKDGLERSRSIDRKTDAQAQVTQVTTNITVGTYVDRGRGSALFRDVADEWLSAVGQKLKQSTLAGYRSELNNAVLPRFGDTALVDIEHGDIQTWVNWMTTDPDARQLRTTDLKKAKRTPLSSGRTIHAYRRMKQVLDYAIRTKRLMANPADDIELPRVVKRVDKALTHDEVAAMVAASGDAGPILETLAYTALRFGELAALRVKDVDVKNRRIQVSKGIAQVTGVGLVEDTTKTHQERVVPILTDHLAATLTEVTQGRKGDEYLFPVAGGPMRNSYLRHRLDKACETAKLEAVTPKTLRHTAGSLALQAGASIVVVQKLLGHKSATTTMNVYAHMLPDDFDNLATAMNNAATGASKG